MEYLQIVQYMNPKSINILLMYGEVCLFIEMLLWAEAMSNFCLLQTYL